MSGYPNAPPPEYNATSNYGNPSYDPYKANANAAYGTGGHPQGGYMPPPQPAYPPQGGYASQPNYGGYGEPMMESGQPAVPKASDDGQIFGNWSDKAVRRGFVKKVYLILFTQLLVTFGMVALFIFVKPVKHWVQNNLWFYLASYILFLILYIVLICCPNVRRKYPGNFICLAAFTLVFSYMTATISCFHDTGIVLMAAGITAAVCLSVSIFAIQTKIDFTMCSGLLFVLVMVLFFFGISLGFTYAFWGYNHVMNCVYGGLAALVFGLFLIYDTQQVMGGRKYELSEEEYIYGALQLYIDVVYIFIIILGFSKN